MRKLYCFTFIITTLCCNPIFGQSAFLNQGLIEKLSESNNNELIPIMILLEDKVDIDALKANFIIENTPVTKRPQLVMEALKSKAAESQKTIFEAIENSGFNYLDIRGFWISNVIEVKASPALIKLLSYREDISEITLNLPLFGLDKPKERQSAEAKSIGGHEIGHDAIGAPAMWALGYTGHGRMAMTFDTGVQPDHPAHRDRFLANRLPLESTWFPYDSPVPTDKPGSHGTHVTGIMLGLDTLTHDTIGVAPQAYFIATDPIVEDIAFVQTLSALMLAYQWAMNPDGDESTSDDVPDVINNSWGRNNDIEDAQWQLCSETVADVLNAVLAAGISNVFSAGNEGPNPATIGIPHNINTGLVNSFTVAAVSGAGEHNVAEFSSRGPSLCGGEGSILIKPEVSAPGISVRSSIQHDEYANFSGTSMAAPHTSGAILLLKEAFPYLSGEELQLALYYSAVDLGVPGEDNTYGMGIINVYEAYLYLSENNTPVPPQVLENDLALVSIDEPSFDLVCRENGQSVVTPVFTVKNTGLNTIDNFSISYSLNDEIEGNYDVNQAIAANEVVQLSLDPITITMAGTIEFHVTIDAIEGEYDLWNNHRTIRWNQINEFDLMGNNGFHDDFENGLASDVWTVYNPDNNITWTANETIQTDNSEGTAAYINLSAYTPIEDQKDKLISPIMNAAGEQYYLSFDYFYRKKGSSFLFQDTLAVLINLNCEEDLEIWKYGGADLWTNENPQANALPESSDDWAHIYIPIPETATEDFYFAFETTNRWGNNILIDNVNLTLANSIDEITKLDFQIFPNPANESIQIIPNPSQIPNEVRIVDVSGRLVASELLKQDSYTIDISKFSPGAYMVFIKYESGQQHAEKLIVE